MPAVVIIVFLCPISYMIYGRISESVTYYRLLWLIPEAQTICYALSKLCASFSGKKKTVMTICVSLLICACGSLMYRNMYMHPAENMYHVPDYVVDICDALHVEGREVQVLVPDEMQQFVRQYDPSICIPYGRQYMLGVYMDEDELRDAMNEEPRDAEKIGMLATYRFVHYIVVPESRRFEENPHDFEEYMTVDGYVIYKNIYLGTDI